MKVVIVPDSFKGTATAVEAAEALAAGWRSVRPSDHLVLRPMADGGEGTLAAVGAGGELVSVPNCTGPDGRSVTGQYALIPDGTAVVELATASGLPLLDRLAPLTATTRGTGEVVAAALDRGARRLLIGLGGSASTDGGAGLLAALGLLMLDASGRQLPDGGAALSSLARVDCSALRPMPPGGVLLLTDVTNPLLGPSGAATVYGPQKGATAADVARLDQALGRLADLLGGDPDQPGAGAAGGTAYGLHTAWGAKSTPGAPAIADLLGLTAAVADADLVITGEGRFDATSLQGKAVGEVLHRAAHTHTTVVAGAATLPALTLTALAGSTAEALARPLHWLRTAGATLANSA
ncbi:MULTISPECIES: glycerate kinase [unclassified Kitasatospora]|uniref:glycerate kinase n=1 Tax=unclassified Kitasatospora TaxID=2633591 RepID=UPI00070F5C31|nr:MULTISPECIES: glycerate kinase [unclassified Kitasatospora]KQV21759.1 glycerate kinase [Kitasatospora sp. Root107]KRB75447.1 glycerate kinase [Kitasatospora sp. Root187]